MNTFNKITDDFLNQLSFDIDEYVLAGNSVANMLEGIPLQGDLDLWVLNCNKDKYIVAYNEIESSKLN